MSKVTGYILRLPSDRQDLFENKMDGWLVGWLDNTVFSEPVNEFNHSRNVPLICFIVNDSDIFTHIASGRKGYSL